MKTLTYACLNPRCGYNLDENENLIGGGTYEVPAFEDVEGDFPHVQVVLIPLDPDPPCDECGEIGEPE